VTDGQLGDSGEQHGEAQDPGSLMVDEPVRPWSPQRRCCNQTVQRPARRRRRSAKDIDFGYLQRDVLPAARLAVRIDGPSTILFEEEQAVAQTKSQSGRQRFFAEADYSLRFRTPMLTPIWVGIAPAAEDGPF